MSGMGQLNVKNQLAFVVKRKLEKTGLRLDPHSTGLMNRMVAQAVDRMVLAKAVDTPGRVIQAQDAFLDFIDCLTKHAKSLGSHPEVTEKAFDRARLEKCPLWPLC